MACLGAAACLLLPSFDGGDITGQDYDAIVRAALIHVPKGRRVSPNLSVRDNLLLGAWLHGRGRHR